MSSRQGPGAGKTSTMFAAAAATGGAHAWGARLRALPAVVRAAFSGAGPVSLAGFLLALAGLVYVLSPLDFLPEALLGPLGLGDDLAVAAASLLFLARAADRVLDEQQEPASQRVVPGVVVSRSDTVSS